MRIVPSLKVDLQINRNKPQNLQLPTGDASKALPQVISLA